jgi:hypothetical protein
LHGKELALEYVRVANLFLEDYSKDEVEDKDRS